MDLLDDPTPGSNTPEFTVGEIAGAVKKLVEAELGWVRVRGEVGRVVLARSGHLYFDLKDDRNVLSCMTWKGQVPGLGMMPEEGLEVVAEGRMTASGFQSKFSLNAQHIAVAGQGALMALLEKRKKTLESEGLFDASRKRPLPYLPDVIGVVTSLQGAVIRDILHRLRDRFPRKVLIWPVAVQGQACAPEVAAAIKGFNGLSAGGALPRPDVLIVARGGGSIEDLWGFNEENVARAAAASDIPLISAVGHETDTTLIDYVADQRAPTPTAAAEMAVPVRLDLMAWTRDADGRLTRALMGALDRRKQRLRDLSRSMPAPERLFDTARQRLDRAERLGPALLSLVDKRRVQLAERSGALRPQVLTNRILEGRRGLARTTPKLQERLHRAISSNRDAFGAAEKRLNAIALPRRISDQAAQVDRSAKRLSQAMRSALQRKSEATNAQARVLQTLGYEATLQRGYVVVRGDGAVISHSKAAKAAGSLELQFADGRVKLQNKAGKAERKPKSKPGDTDQGSLF